MPSQPGVREASVRGCCVFALLKHPAFADRHASKWRGPPSQESRGRDHIPTEVSELLVDTLESHGVVCVVLWVLCGGTVRCCAVIVVWKK
jgi:hypothetical protein